MDRAIGIGMIGCGTIAQLYASHLHGISGVRLVGAVDRDRQRARRLAKRYAMDVAATDAGALLDRNDVGLVFVTTPNHLHAEATLAAAEAGKHVFCDKPLATTLSDARAMIETCDRAGVHLFYGEVDRFLPPLEKAHEAICSGAVGRPFLLRVHRGYTLRPDDTRWKWWGDRASCGGGCLMDAGVHDLYNCRWLMGEVRAVQACVSRYVQPVEAEDTAVVQLRFAGGGLGVLTCTWAQCEGFTAGLEVHGTQGSLRVDWPRDFPLSVYSESAGVVVRNDFDVCWSYPVAAYSRELRHVVACAVGQAEPLVTGRDGLAVLRIIQAAYLSAEQGREVPVAEVG